MSERRHPSIANIDEVDPVPGPTHGTRYGCRDRMLARAVGGKQLGCSYYEVEPGKTAFPFHYHSMNEEALFVISGEGTLRLGDGRYALRAGDYVAFPVGPDHSHQLIATGSEPLRYLCMSTMHPVEIAGYPDSGKVGLRDTTGRKLFFTKDEVADYFAGEPSD